MINALRSMIVSYGGAVATTEAVLPFWELFDGTAFVRREELVS